MLIDRNSKKTATGVLISGCHVLTNRHTVGGIRTVAKDGSTEIEEDLTINVMGNVLEFQIGFDARSPFKSPSVAKATVVASGRGGDIDDWAVLRLDQHFGKRYGVASIRGVPFSAGEPLVTAGYPTDNPYLIDDSGRLLRNVRLWKQDGVLEADRAYWTADFRVMAGQSGSPVFAKKDSGYIVIGLLRGEFPPSSPAGRSTAQVVPLVNAVERLRAAIEEHPCN